MQAGVDLRVEGHRQFNPGWHLALDLRNMLLVSECIAKAALARQESRGGHTRDDFPAIVVSPQSADVSEFGNTTLGISFIGLANGPEAPGQ